jgi:hypothetical protein
MGAFHSRYTLLAPHLFILPMEPKPSHAIVEELYLHHGCIAKAPWLTIPKEFDMVDIYIL